MPLGFRPPDRLNQMIRKVRLALCIAALFLIQVTLAHRLSYRFLRPDLLLLCAAYLALESDFRGALWAALILGLLRDLGSAGPIGASALLMVPAAAGLNSLKEHLVRKSAVMDALLALLYFLSVGVLYAMGTVLTTSGALPRLMLGALGQAVYTAALSPLLFAGFDQIGLVEEQR